MLKSRIQKLNRQTAPRWKILKEAAEAVVDAAAEADAAAETTRLLVLSGFCLWCHPVPDGSIL